MFMAAKQEPIPITTAMKIPSALSPTEEMVCPFVVFGLGNGLQLDVSILLDTIRQCRSILCVIGAYQE